MKYVINIMAVVMFGWPALIVGYIWQTIVSGFETGEYFYEKHEAASINKFVKKSEKQT